MGTRFMTYLHVESIGNGPDLVLLHGWAMHSGIWSGVRDQLAQQFHVHLVDLPGHGLSPACEPGTLNHLVEVITEILPEHCMIGGWSLGGQIAMRIALDHPATPQRLILISTTPKFVADECWQVGIAREDLQTFGADMQNDTRATLLRFLSLQTRGVAAQKSILQNLRASFFSEPLPEPQALVAGLEMLLQTDLRAEAAQLAQPTMVIHGSLDKLTPPGAGTWLAKNLPSARAVLIDGAAHSPFLSHTQQVAQTILEALHD